MINIDKFYSFWIQVEIKKKVLIKMLIKSANTDLTNRSSHIRPDDITP